MVKAGMFRLMSTVEDLLSSNDENHTLVSIEKPIGTRFPNYHTASGIAASPLEPSYRPLYRLSPLTALQ